MTVSKAAMVEGGRARKEPADGAAEGGALQLGELSELLGELAEMECLDRRLGVLAALGRLRGFFGGSGNGHRIVLVIPLNSGGVVRRP